MSETLEDRPLSPPGGVSRAPATESTPLPGRPAYVAPRAAAAPLLPGSARPVRLPNGAAALLYFVLGLFVMAPMLSTRMVDCPASDYWAHAGALFEAQSAVKERQFPLRVTPWQHGGGRYPFFQYYGNFPYTMAGLFSLVPGLNPYAAGLLVLVLAMSAGGYFTYQSARVLTRHPGASLIAGAAFVTAPYEWTDIHSRFAYTESVAFNMLPAVLYFSLRAFRSPRWRYVCLAGLLWSFTVLSHNPVYAYASLLLGLFFGLGLRPTRKGVVRLGRVGLGFGLGVALSLWFVIPQFYTLKDIWIGSFTQDPYGSRVFTEIATLLSPRMFVSEGAFGSNNLLATQVGWPILLGVVLALAAVLTPRGWRGLRRGGLPTPGAGVTVALLLMFAVAFMFVWSPTSAAMAAFWQRIPKIFTYIQFTYRLLVFTTLFGCVVLAAGLAAWWPRRAASWRATGAGLFVVGAFAASYASPNLVKVSAEALDAVQAAPDVGAAGGSTIYTVFPGALKRTDVLQSAQAEGYAYVPREQTRRFVRRGRVARYRGTLERPTLLEMPVLFYPGLLSVTDHGKPIAYGNVDHWLALKLQPGPHRIEARFVGVRWANYASAAAWVGTIAVLVGGAVAKNRRRSPAAPFPVRRGATRPWWPSRWAPAGGATFAAAAVGAGLLLPLDRFLRFAETPRKLTATASRASPDPAVGPDKAVDGNIMTSWIPGHSDPVTLTLVPDRPGRIKSVRLIARRPGMMAGWQTVRIEPWFRGGPIILQEINFPWANRELEQRADLKSVPCDKLVLHFRDPVNMLPDNTPLPVETLDPGYMEIQLSWEQ